MLAVPEPWFAAVAASTGPLNVHLVRDVGAAYFTSGAAALWGAFAPAWRAPLAAAAACFQLLHAAIHGFDVAAGAAPPAHLLEDLPTVYLPSLLLAWAAVKSLRSPYRATA
jgi:hypothetical protein